MQELETHYVLSKSTFIRGLQCEKSLYFYKNTQIKRDPISAEQKALFSRGTDIGKYAWNLFPGGIDASPNSLAKYDESVLKTRECITANVPTIYEAAFIHNKVLVALDILVNNDGWRAYEVKSSTRITATYLMDAALQYYVITKSGIELKDFSIVFVNKDYIKKGEINFNDFFIVKSVLHEILERQALIEETIQKSFATLAQINIPEKGIGEHCFYPYNCDYRGTCWKGMPQNSVFDLVNYSKHDQFAMYREGTILLEQIENEKSFKKDQQTQIWCAKNKTDFIDKQKIKEYLAQISDDVYFFDIEAYMPSIPIFEDTKPFEHIPFLFSMHYLSKGILSHEVYLTDVNSDQRKQFALAFLNATKNTGNILVFDDNLERRVLNKLAQLYPELAEQMQERLNRIVDIRNWFSAPVFYSLSMKGSYSLKAILPALVPDVNYDELSINGGAGAMVSFEKLQKSNDIFEIEELKQNLKAYCTMDTFGLYKIFQKLQELSLLQ
ncbi:MAG: DUF2779 domain-containing protein [Bacteroidota bacterium]